MSKPGFFFYTGDWLKKTRMLSLQARGAWIDLLSFMDERRPRGRIKLNIDQYAGILGCSSEIAAGILLELESQGVADVSPTLQDVTFPLRVTANNFFVTVESRRMLREEKDRESNRVRQKRHRESRQSNGAVTPPLLNPSPSPSLLSLNSENNSENYSLPGDVSNKRSRTATWPEDSLWLKSFLENEARNLVPTPNGTLLDPRWWNSVSETCGGLSLPFLTTEFNRMSAWLTENPSRSPAKPKGWKRFIRTWLERAHERERRQANAPARRIGGQFFRR